MKFNYLALLMLSSVFLSCEDADKDKYILTSGNIESISAIISSKNAGEIKEIFIDEGERVKSGDKLLLIDEELYGIQLKQAKAAKDFAEAQLSLLLKGARNEDIKQSEEIMRQAEINFSLAKTDKERMENLVKSSSISQKQYEDAVARYQTMEAQFNAARENYRKLKNYARPEEIKQARANFEKAEAGYELALKNLSDCLVKSPIDGVVSKKYFQLGESVSPGGALFRIVDLHKVDLVVYISELELPKIKPGSNAEIAIDAYPTKKYWGRIVYISPEAEFTPKNIQTKDERTKLVFAVKIRIDNPEFELKPGMPADAKIIIN